jgi:hypothetical protein
MLSKNVKMNKKKITAIWFILSACVCKLDAMLVNAPANANCVVTLSRQVESFGIAAWQEFVRNIALQVILCCQAWPLGFFEAPTPFVDINDGIVV